jgi:phosphoribosylformylglycinamidine cyclo-ligase
LVHITGGGIIENPPRILPEGCAISIKKDSFKIPPIFEIIKNKGNIFTEEMMRTFNCGIGLMVVSKNEIKEGIFLGRVVKGDREVFIK